MPYTPILGTLGYIVNRETNEVLLVHRNKRANDEHLGKWNGLGGKLETNEDLASGMRREIRRGRHRSDVHAPTWHGLVARFWAKWRRLDVPDVHHRRVDRRSFVNKC